MAERGAYRSIKVVLWDGPDFQQLPERARWVFVTLKASFGPSGIEVHYPEALAHELAAKTGAPIDGIRGALDTLESAGWIRRERNVLWIIGQLQHEPSLEASNGNHRKSVQRHVAGLPRMGIVRAFIESHPEWFTDLDDPTDGYPMASEGLSDGIPIGTAITEDRQEKTEYRRPKTEDGNTTVDKSTEAGASKNGAPPPIETIADTGQRIGAYLAHFMPIIREVGLSDDDTNGSILKALAKRRAPPRDLEDVIRGLPLVASELNEGELRWVYAARKEEIAEPAWNKAKRAYHESQKGKVSPMIREMVG